jgi:hypothetical protein
MFSLNLHFFSSSFLSDRFPRKRGGSLQRGRRGVGLFAGRELQYALLNFLEHHEMKHLLLTTIAAVVLVGCGEALN